MPTIGPLTLLDMISLNDDKKAYFLVGREHKVEMITFTCRLPIL